MDDMELDGTPSKQPEDPFKGDAKVTAEKPQDPFGGDEAVAAEQPAPAQAEQVEQAESVTAEAQPQPAAEAVAEEKPKWQKIVGKVSIILIAVAGLLSALFMCLLSYQVSVNIIGNKSNVNAMLSDVIKSIQENADKITEYINNASEPDLAYVIDELRNMLFDTYTMIFMIVGLVAGIILGIMLIVKVIKQFAMKKETAMEKTAITSCLFFFATAAIVLSMAMQYNKTIGGSLETKYGPATLAGLILVGLSFAAYFVLKIVANYKMYLGDRVKLINGCFNLGWAVVAMLVLALLSCAPVVVSANGVTAGRGFNYLFTNGLCGVLENADSTSDELLKSFANQYIYGALGMVIQIWFIFQTGKSLHGAMRGTVTADKTVKLGSQIWRLVFAVLYLIVCIVLSKDIADGSGTISLAAPIVILIFSVIGLVLAIVNKILVKEQANKKEI